MTKKFRVINAGFHDTDIEADTYTINGNFIIFTLQGVIVYIASGYNILGIDRLE